MSFRVWCTVLCVMIALETAILAVRWSRKHDRPMSKPGKTSDGTENNELASVALHNAESTSHPRHDEATEQAAAAVAEFLALTDPVLQNRSKKPASSSALRAKVRENPAAFLEEAMHLRSLPGREASDFADILLMVLAGLSREEIQKVLPPADQLVSLLRSDVSAERYLWAFAVNASDDESVKVEVLRVAAWDPDATVRSRALQTCAKFADEPRFAAALLATARNEADHCRPFAIRGLAKASIPGAIEAIVQAAGSRNLDHRKAAFEALAVRATWDPSVAAELSKLANTSLETADAKYLWDQLSQKKLLQNLPREDLARLESLCGSR